MEFWEEKIMKKVSVSQNYCQKANGPLKSEVYLQMTPEAQDLCSLLFGDRKTLHIVESAVVIESLTCIQSFPQKLIMYFIICLFVSHHLSRRFTLC
jgi:hypothetical protein